MAENFQGYVIFLDTKDSKLSATEATRWTQDVLQLLKKIERSKVGKVLLEFINVNNKPVIISSDDECGADVSSLPDGSKIFIAFNLDSMSESHSCQTKYKTYGQYRQEPDETLFHELVHAYRQGSGAWKHRGNLGAGLAMYHTTEEFNAVVMQGIYASENKTPIRDSHYRHYIMEKELSDSFRFFQSGSQTFLFILKFCLESPDLTKRISGIKLPFNPIWAYYSDPKKAEKFSRSELAKRRDRLMPMVQTIIRENYFLTHKAAKYSGKNPLEIK